MAIAQRVRRLPEIVTSIACLELVKVRDVIRTLAWPRLERDGCRLGTQVGSHRQFRHPNRPGTVTVAGKPSDKVPKGMVGSIWRPGGRECSAATERVVVIEREGDAWGAYVPDFPGWVVVGYSSDEVDERIAEAVPLHIQSLRKHGEPIPPPTAIGSTKIRVA